MFPEIKIITSDTPIIEIWKRLRYFLDEKYVAQKIRDNHNVPRDQEKSNVDKQAKQTQYCLLQAEEYFRASSQVTLATRPLLLYYGCVSLSQALILLKRDGGFSLDARRKGGNKKFKHHGLELIGDIERVPTIDQVKDVFEAIRVSLYKINGEPIGHFPVFYQCLTPGAVAVTQTIRDIGKPTILENYLAQPLSKVLNLEKLVAKKLSILTLTQNFPDMFSSLNELGIENDLCSGNCSISVERRHNPSQNNNDQSVKRQSIFNFYLDGISEEKKHNLLQFYRHQYPDIKLITDYGRNIHLTLKRSNQQLSDNNIFYIPDMVDDMYGKLYYLMKPDEYIPEPASILMMLYCLGMLSRYYPDIWMKLITKRSQIAEFLDTFLNIAYRKFPMLILDQLTFTKHILRP